MRARLSISNTYTGPHGKHAVYPPIGPALETGRQRALLGWKVHTDSQQALNDPKNQLWCWVINPGTKGEALHVYDSEYNRGQHLGQHYDSGHLNFSQVRMFHPYWCPGGQIPRDLVPKDKAQTRALHRQLIQYYFDQNNGGNGGGSEDSDDDKDFNDLGDNDDPDPTLTAPQRTQRRQERLDRYHKFLRAQVIRHRNSLKDRIGNKLSKIGRQRMENFVRRYHRLRAKLGSEEASKQSKQKRKKTVASSTTHKARVKTNTRRTQPTTSPERSSVSSLSFLTPNNKAQYRPAPRFDINDDEDELYDPEPDNIDSDDDDDDDDQPLGSLHGGSDVVILDGDDGQPSSSRRGRRNSTSQGEDDRFSYTLDENEDGMARMIEEHLPPGQRGTSHLYSEDLLDDDGEDDDDDDDDDDVIHDGVDDDGDGLFVRQTPSRQTQDNLNSTSLCTHSRVKSNGYESPPGLDCDEQDTHLSSSNRTSETSRKTSAGGSKFKHEDEQKPTWDECDDWFIDNSVWSGLKMADDDRDEDIVMLEVRTRSPESQTYPRKDYFRTRGGHGSREEPLVL